MEAFSANRRSLLRDADIDKSETVTISTTSRTHLNASCVLDTPEKRKKRSIGRLAADEQRMKLREFRVGYPENPFKKRVC